MSRYDEVGFNLWFHINISLFSCAVLVILCGRKRRTRAKTRERDVPSGFGATTMGGGGATTTAMATCAIDNPSRHAKPLDNSKIKGLSIKVEEDKKEDADDKKNRDKSVKKSEKEDKGKSVQKKVESKKESKNESKKELKEESKKESKKDKKDKMDESKKTELSRDLVEEKKEEKDEKPKNAKLDGLTPKQFQMTDKEKAIAAGLKVGKVNKDYQTFNDCKSDWGDDEVPEKKKTEDGDEKKMKTADEEEKKKDLKE